MVSNSSFEKNKILTILLSLGIEFFAVLNQIIRKIPYRNSNKVVIISLHKIGDTIFSFPTIRFFREKFGDNLTIVCLKSTKTLYDLLDLNLNIVVIPDKYFYFNGRMAGFKAKKILHQLRPRMILDISGEINSVSLFTFTRTHKIKGRCAKYLKSFYNDYVIKEEKPSLSDRIFDVAKLTDPQAVISDYQLQPKINPIIKNICIHPYAGWKAKEWNFNKFINLAEELSKEYSCTFIVEQDFISRDVKAYILTKNIEIKITHTLSELIAEIRNCDLFIGNDSGPANIAFTLRKQTFVIYGPVNPKYCFTPAPNTSYISKQLKCTPKGLEHYCFTNAGRKGCPSFECMNQLSVSEVLEAVTKLINK